MPSPEVVLIHPGNSRRLYQSLSNELTAIEPPVWASLLASYLLHQGHHPAIIDAEAEFLDAGQVALRVQEMTPQLAVVVAYGHQPSASTQMMTETSRITVALKETTPEIPILLLGGHVAALPVRTLEDEACDFVAIGEGLVTVQQLLHALKSPTPDFQKVRGLGYRKEGRVELTQAAPLCQNLDQVMPRQAWELLDMSLYRAHNWHCFQEANRQPYASVYTSLGCPYHCSFCCIQAPFKSGEQALGIKNSVNSYRRWSPAAVVDQLEYLASEYGVRHVKFADEMFVLNRTHVTGICRAILRRKLDLNIWAYARVDTVKDELVGLMREAGFRWLALGIESGNQRVLDGVGKSVSRQQTVTTVDKLRSAGINVIGNFIFGLPDDDTESMVQTLDLAQELRCEFANFYCAMAYPGSPLYREAVKEGWPLPDDWAGYSQHSFDTLPLPTRYLTGREVLRFRDEAFHRYYEDPAYLDFMEKKFGAEVRGGIEKMTSVRLERRYTA